LLLGSLGFALGLVAAAWGLRSLAARYARPGGEKLEPLMHADDYDVAVIGSSMIGVGFREEPFEQRLREKHDRNLRVFGLGMGGLHGAELDFYVHQILEVGGPRLRWLLVDITLNQEPRMAETNWYTERELTWQTPRQFAIVATQVAARDDSFLTKLETLWPYTRHLALNVLNVGRALPALRGFDRRNLPVVDAPEESAAKAEQRRARKDAKSAKYMQRPERHASAVRKLIAKRRRPQERDNALQATWRDAAAARGVELAYIVGPGLGYAAFSAEVAGEPDLRVFDFNDPRKYPRLYEIENRYDGMHLTERGAREFSLELADALDAAMDEVEER
jgi:hypothetical protein